MDPTLLELAKHPDLRVGHALIDDIVLGLPGSYALISQPEPLVHVSDTVKRRAATTIMATALDEAFLVRTAASLPDVTCLVGIGGGVTMDVTRQVHRLEDGHAARPRAQHRER